jgi:hypothetical protein
MTDRPLGDAALDAAIDGAVRELMGAEPRADLRERVLSELAGPSSRAVLWPRFAFGLVAAAAVIVAVQFVPRPSERRAEQTVAALPAAAERPRTDGAPLTPHIPPPVLPRTPQRAAGSAPTTPLRRTAVDDRPIQAASIETAQPLGVAPLTPLVRLNPIEPIALSRLEAPEIPAPAIDIKLLTIAQMENAPLTPRR